MTDYQNRPTATGDQHGNTIIEYIDVSIMGGAADTSAALGAETSAHIPPWKRMAPHRELKVYSMKGTRSLDAKKIVDDVNREKRDYLQSSVLCLLKVVFSSFFWPVNECAHFGLRLCTNYPAIYVYFEIHTKQT